MDKVPKPGNPDWSDIVRESVEVLKFTAPVSPPPIMEQDPVPRVAASFPYLLVS
jgi:hypothetical protein